MQKFKHKNTGDIAELVNDSGYKINKNTIGLVPKEYIQNSSDWEEIIEKEYEILSFLDNQDKILYHRCSETTCFKLGYKIHSVKRLSDGEVFTIGDVCHPNRYPDSKHPIKKIWFCDPGYLRLSSDKYTIGIENLVKAKKSLFTTEDGVDIYKGDNYYYTRKDTHGIVYTGNASFVPHSDLITFSTKEKAEEYIIMNKLCLSIKDIRDIHSYGFKNSSLENKLKDLVKQKSNL